MRPVRLVILAHRPARRDPMLRFAARPSHLHIVRRVPRVSRWLVGAVVAVTLVASMSAIGVSGVLLAQRDIDASLRTVEVTHVAGAAITAAAALAADREATAVALRVHGGASAIPSALRRTADTAIDALIAAAQPLGIDGPIARLRAQIRNSRSRAIGPMARSVAAARPIPARGSTMRRRRLPPWPISGARRSASMASMRGRVRPRPFKKRRSRHRSTQRVNARVSRKAWLRAHGSRRVNYAASMAIAR